MHLLLRPLRARTVRRRPHGGGIAPGCTVSGAGPFPETATIAFVDVVESVRHVQRDERRSIERMRDLMQSAVAVVAQHQGHVVERLGDGLVLRFDGVHQAVRCAKALHQLAADEGRALPETERLQLRAGVHHAPIWSDANGLYGLGVNLAARVAAMGGPGDTIVTASARDQLVAGLELDLHDLGLCYLKHVEEPVRLFRVQAARPLSVGLKQAIAARMKTRPTLAVMPFGLTLSGDVRATAPTPSVADIVSQQVIGQLSRSPMLHVISGMSTKALRDRSVPKAALFQALGADYLLLGQARACDAEAQSSRLEVGYELWRAGSGEAVLADTQDAAVLDVLSPHSDLIARITQTVSHRVLAVEQRLARGMHALPNLASHTLYLTAVDLLHRFSVQDFERARQMLLALNERAPRHPEPLAWLARWHVFRVVQGWTDDSARDSTEALAYSEQALDRDPESALALTMAGSVYAGVRRDPGAAQGYYEQALKVNPNESMAWAMSGVAQGFMSIRELALAASETALGLAPFDPLRYYYDSLSASAALMSGETGRALELAQRSVYANACHGSAYRVLAAAKVLTGSVEEARGVMDRMLSIEPQFTVQTYLNRVGVDTPKSREVADALRLAGLPES